jgi:hypothetical protein
MTDWVAFFVRSLIGLWLLGILAVLIMILVEKRT